MSLRVADRLRMRGLLAVRRINRASIERWSKHTYRRTGPPWPHRVDAVPAAAHHAMPDVPPGLWVPGRLPRRLRLGLLYEVPYYILAGTAFELYRRSPIPADAAWDPSVRLELRSDEGWTAIEDDAEFAQLRVQGSNPFRLRRTDDDHTWEVDYGPAFEGLRPALRCTFRLGDHGLHPLRIRIGADTFTPGDGGWRHAKRLANALDARDTVFGQHLLRTHLVVSQAYALAATVLPPSHPLRAFMDVHTYGSMHVNHYAWKLLLAPTSYFLQARFIDRPSALRLMRNCLEGLRYDDLVLPVDLRTRGLDRFPDHPYAVDAMDAWSAMEAYAADVADVYGSDAAVRDDAALRAWHTCLVGLFPRVTDRLARLETREDLHTLLAVLVFNNVLHEVSGDFSTYMTSPDPDVKRLVNFEECTAAEAPLRLNDVFLFEQGAFSGMFNTAGNNMVDTAVPEAVSDPRYGACLARFRQALAAVDARVAARNARRRYPFTRMRPRQWELSVSF